MNIHLNFLYSYSNYFPNDRVMQTLQKKILIIASIALGCLAAYYIMRCFCFKVQLPKGSENDEDFDFDFNINLQKQKDFHLKEGVDAQVKAFFSPKKEEKVIVPLEHDEERIQTLKRADKIYEGEVKDGKPNGRGKITFFYGLYNIIEGEFKDGKLNGQGKKIHSDKKVEEGEFKDGELNGQGKITYSNGKIEEGEFKNGRLNGQGKITYSNGTIAEGEFKNSKLNGQGKITYSNGTIEEGEFKDNSLNGKGKITYLSEVISEGEFKDGKLNGNGKKNFERLIQEGEFKSGRLYRSIHPQIQTSKSQFKIDHIPSIKSSLQLTDFQDVLLDVSDALGPSSTGITENYVRYIRTLVFGFSIGQKQKMTKISSQSGIELNELMKLLEGGHSNIHMIYVAHHVDKLISQLKSRKADEIDRKYLEGLQKLQSTLQRSLPIALMFYYVIHKNVKDQVLEQLTEDICKELDKMEQGEHLLIPITINEHATLLALQKMRNGALLPTLYNTGRGVENHMIADLKIEALIDQLNTWRHHYPLSIIYPSFDLKSCQTPFKTMIKDLLKLPQEAKEIDAKKLYTALEETFGKGKKGPTRPAQINGTCSFQVLTEALKHILGSKRIYNTYKLDLLNSIQDEFQEITDEMELLIDENDRMKNFYKLHQILLEENQKQIDITKQKLRSISNTLEEVIPRQLPQMIGSLHNCKNSLTNSRESKEDEAEKQTPNLLFINRQASYQKKVAS